MGENEVALRGCVSDRENVGISGKLEGRHAAGTWGVLSARWQGVAVGCCFASQALTVLRWDTEYCEGKV